MRKKNSNKFCLGSNADCSDIISKHQFIFTCEPLITVWKFRVVFWGGFLFGFSLLRNNKNGKCLLSVCYIQTRSKSSQSSVPWDIQHKLLGCIKCSTAKGRDYFLSSAIIKPHAILAPLRKWDMLINFKKSRGGSQRQWRLKNQAHSSPRQGSFVITSQQPPDLRGGYRKDSARLFTKVQMAKNRSWGDIRDEGK